MKKRLLFLLFLASLSSFAQYTAIPDINFENKLIVLGIDSGLPDGQVLTSQINTITSLDVANSTIADLTGIQGFINLIDLNCNSNQLNNLDVSKNVVLTNLACKSNQINSLNVSKNVVLTNLACKSNQLSSLDVSQNVTLTSLDCSFNKLINLDVSKNVALTSLDCSNNILNGLNLKNGYNNFLLQTNSDFKFNPNLTCIEVDDIIYSNNNWINLKDITASYNTNCPSLGLAESVFNTMIIYPNPTFGEFHIDNVALEKVAIYNALGNLVKELSFANSLNNTINISTLSKGIYFMHLQAEGVTTFKKIIVE
jgi:Secretion system C-terminal sorting domain